MIDIKSYEGIKGISIANPSVGAVLYHQCIEETKDKLSKMTGTPVEYITDWEVLKIMRDLECGVCANYTNEGFKICAK